jgi:NTE family protein
MKVDLVFEGGGILGVSFVGAYEALMKKGYVVHRCAGTSAGSIISALIIAGYTVDELKQIINNTDFSQFATKTKLAHISLIGKPLSLIFNKGLYDIKVVERWIEGLLEKKGIRTFKDVMINNQSRLKIVGADITDRELLILPEDSELYGIKPENFSVAKAVAMSCSIPLFFTPIKMEKDNQVNYVVDGGLLSTFPIWIFDVEGTPMYPTLGFKIKDKVSNSSQGKTGIVSYIKDLIDASYSKEETTFVRDEDLVRTVTIDFDNSIKSTDFNMDKDKIDYLYNCGYVSTNKFLETWDFISYVKRYRL